MRSDFKDVDLVKYNANVMYMEQRRNRFRGPAHKGIPLLDKQQYQDGPKYWLAVADIMNARKIEQLDAQVIVEKAILDYSRWYPKESARTWLDMVVDQRESGNVQVLR